jgi:CheY-like chemotaxis protein
LQTDNSGRAGGSGFLNQLTSSCLGELKGHVDGPWLAANGGDGGMANQMNILVLDDHVDVAASIGEILELDGHQVTLVHNGESAVAAFSRKSFDLGLFDVKMPGMNGVESFIEIRKFRPNANVVMMSGFADDGVIEKALKNGARGLLRKPFEVEDLMAKLEELSDCA